MDKQEQLRSMLAAGWTVSRIRETTRIHTKTIAKFRRQWQSDQSDLGVSTEVAADLDLFRASTQIANFERIASEMEAAHGPQIASPPRGRPRKGEVRTPMIGKTVKLPETVWKTLQSQARKQHTTVKQPDRASSPAA